MTIRVGELCDSGSLQKKHLDVLVLLPVEYLNRTLRRKIVSTLASQTDAVANRLNLLAFLKFTKDDAGQPLVSQCV